MRLKFHQRRINEISPLLIVFYIAKFSEASMRFIFNMFEYILFPACYPFSFFIYLTWCHLVITPDSLRLVCGLCGLQNFVLISVREKTRQLHFLSSPFCFQFSLLSDSLIPSSFFLLFPPPLLFSIYHSLLYKDEAGYRLSCIKASNLMYRELNKLYISQFVTHYYYYKAPFSILSFFSPVYLLSSSPLIFHPQLTLICLIYDHGSICVLEKYIVILYIQVFLIYSNGVIFGIQFYIIYFLFSTISNISLCYHLYIQRIASHFCMIVK